MARKLWFRLYTEIMDDTKLAGWTGDQFRILIYLFCLARESDRPGHIGMTPAEIAWRVRRPVTEVEETLARAQEGDRPIIEARDDGFLVVRFLDRQYEHESDRPENVKARVQKHRESKKSNDEKRICNDEETRNKQKQIQIQIQKQSRAEDVTSAAALRSSTEEEGATEARAAGISAAIFKRPLAGKELDKLVALLRQHPESLVMESMRRAVARGRPKVHYAEAILSDWAEAGLKTVDDVLEADPAPVGGNGQAPRADPEPEKVVQPNSKRREEAIRAACDFIKLHFPGREPPEDQARAMAAEYGEDLVPDILGRLYEGGRSP